MTRWVWRLQTPGTTREPQRPCPPVGRSLVPSADTFRRWHTVLKSPLASLCLSSPVSPQFRKQQGAQGRGPQASTSCGRRCIISPRLRGRGLVAPPHLPRLGSVTFPVKPPTIWRGELTKHAGHCPPLPQEPQASATRAAGHTEERAGVTQDWLSERMP